MVPRPPLPGGAASSGCEALIASKKPNATTALRLAQHTRGPLIASFGIVGVGLRSRRAARQLPRRLGRPCRTAKPLLLTISVPNLEDGRRVTAGLGCAH